MQAKIQAGFPDRTVAERSSPPTNHEPAQINRAPGVWARKPAMRCTLGAASAGAPRIAHPAAHPVWAWRNSAAQAPPEKSSVVTTSTEPSAMPNGGRSFGQRANFRPAAASTVVRDSLATGEWSARRRGTRTEAASFAVRRCPGPRRPTRATRAGGRRSCRCVSPVGETPVARCATSPFGRARGSPRSCGAAAVPLARVRPADGRRFDR